MIDFGTVRPGTTIYIPFATYDSNDPTASVTLTGLATTDIEIYKDGGTTQRGSDNGYALLDTDGIDFDSLTGIHGFSVNLADNSTAGFYAAGSQYWVVVSSITVDSGTISFIAATFRIGYPDAILNTTIATLASQTSFTLTAGPADDNALVGCVVLIHDVASAVQVEMGVCSAYTGSTKTVTLAADPGVFTAAASDNIAFYFPINTRWIGQTAQTGRDIGASVLLSSGTGTGQVTLTSGRVNADVTHIATAAVSTTTAQLGVNVVQVSGDATAADNAEAFFDGTGYAGTNNVIPTVTTTTNLTNLPAAAATAAELAKVPKSDSTVSWNATALAAINAEVDTALNTAIPGSPTANSVNERIATMDGLLLGTVAAGTHVAQSGDSFARLGAPAGASVSVDVAAIKSDTAAILTDTGTTLDTLIKDIPTVAEFEARTLVAADYVVVTDTIARVTLVDTTTTNTDMVAAAPSAAAVADAVWDEAIAGHAGAGSTGAALSAASSAGDPWGTAVPGAYGAGTAGNILGNRLVGTIATGTHNPQTGDAYARLGAPAGASVSADVAAVKSDTAAVLLDTGTDGVVVAAASKTGYTLTATTGLGNQTANITGNLSGSVGSVTGAVGSVTGAVGSVAEGGIASTSFATGAITATAIAADAIGASELAADAASEIGTAVWATATRVLTANTNLNDPTAAAIADAVWDEALSGHTTAGTAGLALATASSGGVDPSVLADAIWDEALSGHATAGTTGKKLTDLANADLSGVATSTALATVAGYIDTEVAAIKTKTDYLPSATAGSAGGLFIAGSNAATSVTTALTANITGNLSGSVGSVTGAVGSVTGAVGSVTGAVGSVAANGITATSIATDAINAASVKADAVTKIQSGLATPTNITAGTITTVTNLTNAPTAGDLTATMKTSVTAAATAATPTAAAVTGAVGSVTGNVGGNVVGSVASVTAGVTLANDAITAAKFDESTAFPLASVDTGATRVARTGADADTLETISDQLDAAVLDGVLFLGDTQIA